MNSTFRSISRYMLFCLMLSCCLPLHKAEAVQNDSQIFSIEILATGLDPVWGMDFLSDREIIFTEKSGSISILDTDTQTITRLQGTPPVKDSGQGGMLDVKKSPQYRADGWIYFTYSKRIEKYGVTTLARAKRSDNSLIFWDDMLITRSATDTNRHYGSRIAFDTNGHLFFTVGERGERPNAQDLTNHAGKVLRLNLDGTVPSDNPFLNTPKAQPEIFSYGHRNPQGITYDTSTDRLWLIEHGPRGGDEINRILPGKNYGWPVVSHGKEYYGPIAVGEGTEKEGMEPPIKVYIPSIAPGSLILYSGKAFPEWKGCLLAGALKLRHINIIHLDPSGKPTAEKRILESFGERIRALVEGPDGNIYFSTDSGKIGKIRPV